MDWKRLFRNVAIAVAVGIVVGLITGITNSVADTNLGGGGVGAAIGITFALLHFRPKASTPNPDE
jgi:hypothetical protein